MDLFDCSETLAAIWPRLSGAYFFDSLRNQRRRKKTSRVLAERFVERVVSRYVEESNWHASQQLSKQKDGSIIAEFDLSETEEIKRWIMSFGKHAVVLAPDELRQEMAEELETLLAAYGDGGAGKERLSAAARKA